jgi:DNA-binding NtrC family response regulator
LGTYRVLFIDDDPGVLRSLGDYFKALGHEVYRAESGKDGIKIWEQAGPDVTVLDLYMPEMDGLEVLRILRQQRAAVIMLTAYGEIDTAVEAMKLGAENFLTKPIEMDHLVQAVEKAAEKNQLRVENVRLRARLKPSIRKRVLRTAALVLLVSGAVVIGALIGGGEVDRPLAPIPVPIDTTP